MLHIWAKCQDLINSCLQISVPISFTNCSTQSLILHPVIMQSGPYQSLVCKLSNYFHSAQHWMMRPTFLRETNAETFFRQHCRLNICCYIGWIDKYWNLTNITTNTETAALSTQPIQSHPNPSIRSTYSSEWTKQALEPIWVAPIDIQWLPQTVNLRLNRLNPS